MDDQTLAKKIKDLPIDRRADVLHQVLDDDLYAYFGWPIETVDDFKLALELDRLRKENGRLRAALNPAA